MSSSSFLKPSAEIEKFMNNVICKQRPESFAQFPSRDAIDIWEKYLWSL